MTVRPSQGRPARGWSYFAPLEAGTTATAAQLVKHARVRAELDAFVARHFENNVVRQHDS